MNEPIYEQMQQLIQQIRQADTAYYKHDAPIMSDLEYDRLTLDSEYKRDLKKHIPITLPENYYTNDDPNTKPLLRWRGAANALFSNWINYYVYQNTPYEWE